MFSLQGRKRPSLRCCMNLQLVCDASFPARSSNEHFVLGFECAVISDVPCSLGRFYTALWMRGSVLNGLSGLAVVVNDS